MGTWSTGGQFGPSYINGSQHEVSVESVVHEFTFGSMCVKRGVLRFWEQQHLRSEKGGGRLAQLVRVQ